MTRTRNFTSPKENLKRKIPRKKWIEKREPSLYTREYSFFSFPSFGKYMIDLGSDSNLRCLYVHIID
jgi:hypothetical protein